jgi:hypothetical protein
MRMRMRRGSESLPHVFTSYLFAQMSVWEESDSNSSKTGRTQEEDSSIDARRRPRPDTRIYVRRGGSVQRSPPSGGGTHLGIRDTAG